MKTIKNNSNTQFSFQTKEGLVTVPPGSETNVSDSQIEQLSGALHRWKKNLVVVSAESKKATVESKKATTEPEEATTEPEEATTEPEEAVVEKVKRKKAVKKKTATKKPARSKVTDLPDPTEETEIR